METITVNKILSVMSKEKFNELKLRGKLIIVKPAPNTEILYYSIPVVYRRKLNDARG